MRLFLVAGVLLTLGAACLLGNESKGTQREVAIVTGPEVVVKVDGDCDPEVWEKASKFVEQGDAESTKWAIEFLRSYLDDWDSQCKALIKKLLQGIGEHHPEEGIEVLVRFLHQAPELPWAETFAGAAAGSLVAYGSIATDVLVESTGSSSDRIAAASAFALGRLSNDQAGFALEQLLWHSSTKVRRNALRGLGNHCSRKATDAAVAALSSDSTDVRGGAMFYLSSCGDEREVSVIASGLADGHEEVRIEALRGLMALKSTGACEKVETLSRDDSSVVRELADRYSREVCGSGRRELD